jgi:hypothetical protein
MSPPFALHVRTEWPAAIRPLDPPNSQPAQILDHRFRKLVTAPLWIQIFIPQDQLSVMFNRALRRDPERARVSEMQQPGRRRREPPAINGIGVTGHECD